MYMACTLGTYFLPLCMKKSQSFHTSVLSRHTRCRRACHVTIVIFWPVHTHHFFHFSPSLPKMWPLSYAFFHIMRFPFLFVFIHFMFFQQVFSLPGYKPIISLCICINFPDKTLPSEPMQEKLVLVDWKKTERNFWVKLRGKCLHSFGIFFIGKSYSLLKRLRILWTWFLSQEAIP